MLSRATLDMLEHLHIQLHVVVGLVQLVLSLPLVPKIIKSLYLNLQELVKLTNKVMLKRFSEVKQHIFVQHQGVVRAISLYMISEHPIVSMKLCLKDILRDIGVKMVS